MPYQEVKDVVTVGRGLGFWGDMVVTLRNNNKVELRSLPQCAPAYALAPCDLAVLLTEARGGCERLPTAPACNQACGATELGAVPGMCAVRCTAW